MLAVISLLAISLFASCGKDDNSDPSDPKCLISGLTDTWEVVCDGFTESGSRQINFIYDSNDRLSKWEWDDGDYILFEYNSNGKLIKTEEHFEDEVYYQHFTWEGNKVTRQTYWGDEPNPSKIIIELNGNEEVVRVDGYYKYDEEWFLVWYDMYTWQNGNIVKVEEYYIDDGEKIAEIQSRKRSRKGMLSNPNLHEDENVAGQKLKSTGGDFVLENILTFTHDDKRNPFSLHQALGLWDLWSPLFQSKNNVVSWTQTEPLEGGEDTWFATIQYEYNVQDYPSILIIEAVVDNECQWVETITFNYKNCD